MKIKFKMIREEKGQLSIMLSIVVMALISLLAFIINVGLFVKAKINLQNAVDAAAWAGASVQARQLSNMAYLNWEIRNTYKEWMMKYYVLGQLSLPWTRKGDPWYESSDKLNFRMKGLANINNIFDRYSVPTTCLHFGSEYNICSVASVPGIPRFESVGIAGISEHQETFLNQVVATKSKDCSERTNLNFAASAVWAYGTGKSIFQGAASIASERPGAWIQSLELGIRMRNLELLANRPPVSEGICASNDGGCRSVEDLKQESGETSLNERPVKAFLSAYRNLGSSDNQDDLKSNFKLYELRMNPRIAMNDLGSLLLPPEGNVKSIYNPREKYYVDLLAYPVNYATFFTSFVTMAGSVAGVVGEGECGPSRTALPVPGYLMGFFKNPNVVTYYAVKGETKFVGLFYPFSKSDGITIKAYAAAMPFGGKIGPRLFDFNSELTGVTPRNYNALSRPYVIGIEVDGEFQPGDPIPSTQDFWIKSTSDVIGGVPENNGGNVKFSIPNLFYTMKNENDLQGQFGTSDKIEMLKVANSPGANSKPPQTDESAGLYDKKQFGPFSAVLGAGMINEITSEQVNKALDFIRAPTLYEVANYMIPTTQESTADMESPAVIQTTDERLGGNVDNGRAQGARNYLLYAPLVGPGLIYSEVADIQTAVVTYIESNKVAITAYQKAIEEVAASIKLAASSFKGNDTGTGNSNAGDAALGIANGQTDLVSVSDCNNISIAQKFGHFFHPSAEMKCDVNPLYKDFIDYLDRKIQEGYIYRNYYSGIFVPPDTQEVTESTNLNSAKLLLSAFAPLKGQGVDENSKTAPHPFLPAPGPLVKRNFYSVKFINIERATDMASPEASLWNKPFWESASLSGAGDDTPINSSRNQLSMQELQEFGNNLFF